MNIDITEIAQTKIKEMIKGQPKINGIRLKVRGGGCSGLMYDLTFEGVLTDDDVIFERDNGNVKLYVDMKSLLYLNNLELNYEGGLNGKGFVFNNPNAKNQCGCGESFAI